MSGRDRVAVLLQLLGCEHKVLLPRIDVEIWHVLSFVLRRHRQLETPYRKPVSGEAVGHRHQTSVTAPSRKARSIDIDESSHGRSRAADEVG
jgi:hypothetical protein